MFKEKTSAEQQAAGELPVSIIDCLIGRAQQAPEAPALLVRSGEALSYRGLLEQVRYSVQALNDLGLGREDRVAVALPPGIEWPGALVSLIAGFTCVPVNPSYSEGEFQTLLKLTRARAIITRTEHVPAAARAAQNCGIATIELVPWPEVARFSLRGEKIAASSEPGYLRADQVAVIFSTSGTTSKAKLIPLPQSIVCIRAWRAHRFVGLMANDRCLDLMPSFHGGSMLISILGTMFAGASSIYPGVVDIAEFEDLVRELKPTWCAMPPPLIEALVRNPGWRQGGPPEGLRAFFTCGAPISAKTMAGIEERFGIPLQNWYGATECGGIAAISMPPALRKPGSVGTSIGLELAVLDESGQSLKPSEAGEVAVRGLGIFAGYENATGSGSTVFPGDWYRTGDRGYLDADGYLFLTGRLGNLINRGGEKISPEEIEEVLRGHPAVRDAVAFPVPHEVLGQDVAALIVARADIGTTEVRHFAARHLAAFRIPQTILIVDAIPRGPTGKIQRNHLCSIFARELASAAETKGGVYHAPRTEIEKTISAIWAKVLKKDRVGIRDRFLDLGGDSLLAVNMLTEVERKLGRIIPLRSFWQAPTVESLASVAIEADYRKSPIMLPVHMAGKQPPLFVVLPGWFWPEVELLSRYLGPDQPLYVLIPDPRPGAGQSGMTREEIVAECVAAITSAQVEGPYFVIGRSVGGLVALDIAQKLRSEGKSIGLVGLLDTHYPGITRRNLLPTPLRQIEFVMGELVAMPQSEWPHHLRRIPARALRRVWRRLSGRYLPSQRANAALYTGLDRLFHEAPEPWPGRIILFAAESSKHRGFLDRRLYWSKVAGQGLEVHLMPGDHNMMVQEPHVREIAATVRQCLKRAHEACGIPEGRSQVLMSGDQELP